MRDGLCLGARVCAACRAAVPLTALMGVCLAQQADVSAATHAAPDRVVSRFRLGPVFEYRATSGGGTFWAVRPFYSKLVDPVSDARVTDVVWPVGTFHRDREQSWWRFGLAYGADQDVRRDDAAWKAALFPLYFQGRTRRGEDYWALFPIYGHLPHVLLMDDIDFTLFPLYLDYEVNGVGRTYIVWPLFSRTGDESGVTRTGVFPLYGQTRRPEATHRYAFWPFWTSAVYDAPRNPGESWMFFPLAGQVARERERQWLALPPFFSHAETDTAERWRMPWPFYETVRTAAARKRSYWPVYGDVEGDGERRWYAAWPLVEHFTLEGKGRRTERSRFFPFYVRERVWRLGDGGAAGEESRYTRVWPFYACEESGGSSRLRVLELSLIRYSGGIERNWAPFWTLYERTGRADGAVRHDALWGAVQFGSGEGEGP